MTIKMEKTREILKEKDFAILALLFFSVIRPIVTVDFTVLIDSPFLKINELFNLTFSYLALSIICFKIKKIDWNIVDILIIMIVVYTGFSFFWGSNPKEITKLIFPTLIYFLTRVSILSPHSAFKILLVLVITFSLPMVFNSILMLGNYGSRGIG